VPGIEGLLNQHGMVPNNWKENLDNVDSQKNEGNHTTYRESLETLKL
jgi:hypothetical protein